ncbi:hypothetical protein GCM10011581_32060 [Saccharopolyspora subtropica]|uniref:Uncharacterized protein n=1 Tax=Saccharopolyspora thermophila TaxID=89367 RepID=A0A917JZ59_9PSEU|nr:hypothetical protein [Saccharopolyspora subtropica]GGI92475.1 hypothetical protein GCM10011581_32060 [Saccharopolyspora subtropica]
MGDHNGFHVDLAALEQASKGVNDAIAALEAELPWPARKMANDGYGVDWMTLSADEAGSPVLAEALKKFCGKWVYGVKYLVEEGDAVASALLDTRTGYQKAEEAAVSAFKKILAAGVDNPTADLDAAPQKSFEQYLVDMTPEGPTQYAISHLLNEAGADTKVQG